MKFVFLIFLGVFLLAQEQELIPQACDPQDQHISSLQGSSFLKDDKLEGEMCDPHFDYSTQQQEESLPNKDLDSLKAFINTPNAK